MYRIERQRDGWSPGETNQWPPLGLPTTGNTNQFAIHRDMICDLRNGGRVSVDSEPFLIDGKYPLWEK